MTTQVTSVVKRATSLWVVLLLALEESQITSLRVIEYIRLGVFDSIVIYMNNETNFDNKRVLLQCFGVGIIITFLLTIVFIRPLFPKKDNELVLEGLLVFLIIN